MRGYVPAGFGVRVGQDPAGHGVQGVGAPLPGVAVVVGGRAWGQRFEGQAHAVAGHRVQAALDERAPRGVGQGQEPLATLRLVIGLQRCRVDRGGPPGDRRGVGAGVQLLGERDQLLLARLGPDGLLLGGCSGRGELADHRRVLEPDPARGDRRGGGRYGREAVGLPDLRRGGPLAGSGGAGPPRLERPITRPGGPPGTGLPLGDQHLRTHGGEPVDQVVQLDQQLAPARRRPTLPSRGRVRRASPRLSRRCDADSRARVAPVGASSPDLTEAAREPGSMAGSRPPSAPPRATRRRRAGRDGGHRPTSLEFERLFEAYREPPTHGRPREASVENATPTRDLDPGADPAPEFLPNTRFPPMSTPWRDGRPAGSAGALHRRARPRAPWWSSCPAPPSRPPSRSPAHWLGRPPLGRALLRRRRPAARREPRRVRLRRLGTPSGTGAAPRLATPRAGHRLLGRRPGGVDGVRGRPRAGGALPVLGGRGIPVQRGDLRRRTR